MNLPHIKKKFIHTVLRLWHYFCSDSLFRNSVYIMLGTAVSAGFGFLFWIINTHLFSIEDIGLATTLISVMSLISLFSLIGFDTAFVRYLPTSKQKNEKINTGIILVSITAILLSASFLFGVDFISPRLGFIAKNPGYGFIFIVACVMSSLNMLTDAIFLANRKTNFTLIVNMLFSIFKIVIPFAFISFGAVGIFIATALAQGLGALLSFVIMYLKLDYHIIFAVNKGVLKIIWRYSGANYIAGVLNLLPPTILPILITNRISPSVSAYYYMVMMIGNLLYTIPWSVTKSLFAEGSHDEKSLVLNIRKSIKIISLLLTPAIVILILAGKTILQIFGKNYADQGVGFLYLIVISAIVISINSIFSSIFKVKNSLKTIMLCNFIYTTSILSLSYLLLPLGVMGIGIAWLIGSVITSIFNLILYIKQFSVPRPNRAYISLPHE